MKSIKKVKGKAGKPDKIELIVSVNPVNFIVRNIQTLRGRSHFIGRVEFVRQSTLRPEGGLSAVR